jgi:hypothetical protein
VEEQSLENLGVTLIGHRIGLVQRSQVLLAEQYDGGLQLTAIRVGILDDAVDDGLRPGLQGVLHADEDEGRSEQRQDDESDQGSGGRPGASRCVCGTNDLRRGRIQSGHPPKKAATV